ncbi:LacI family DNA-binding transcriptional regulator [Paenibacillus azoreducens]|uniref:LacI family transcriptional regulator n=1 Tax=Paenibacillus azoreducens TaxID=116718 RepID=A0A919YLB2_9BACL|nr:LacI family DNA-binding transcriptional regulator [Paenibacillus azoreducens]GIO51453.1 LacI family transcriptional regulator [Paenibacillus azoreducens]
MKKVTMQQIADYLGVSKFVVSKALSGKGGVSESTRNRVIQAASQLGYFSKKNTYMKNQPLTKNSSFTPREKSVIILMPNTRFQTKDSLYWGKILEGISERLEAKGLGMVIVSESRVDHFINVLNPEGILGMIGVGQIDSSLLLEVHRLGIPMVLVDHEDSLIPTDTVFANNGDSVARLCNHLIGLGHTRIQFLGNVEFSRSFRDRWYGFRTVLEENGLETPSLNDPMLMLRGVDTGQFVPDFEAWILAHKKAHQMPTALVCANDSIALRVLEVLKNNEIDVPYEISVTGFDNIDDASRSEPTLTTVHVSKEAMGRRAVQKLIERISYPDQALEKILVAAELVHRDSTASISRI